MDGILKYSITIFRKTLCFLNTIKTQTQTKKQKKRATATIELLTQENTHLIDAAIGNGPVDAIFKSINRITNVSVGLTEYDVKAVTGGSDAIGEVNVRITEPVKRGDITFNGHGADPDILVASAKAYISSINKMLAFQKEVSGDKDWQETKKRKVGV